MSFVAKFIRFPAVQNFWKSVKIWQSYGELKVGTFLRHSVDSRQTLSPSRDSIHTSLVFIADWCNINDGITVDTPE